MKYEISRKVILNLTLDSSEAIMFTKGGKHKINLESMNLFNRDIEGDILQTDLEITIQIDPSEFSRFDWIQSEAKKHKDEIMYANENKSS